MLLSINWLKELTPYDDSLEKLAHALTMLGLEVEEIFNPFAEIKKLIIGHVRETRKHPNADKLTVCQVDVGQGDPVQIICGAPNIAANQFVPVALPGTTLPGDLKIKKAKIRGVASAGMICSERELGLSDDHSGIMVIQNNTHPGQRLAEALGLEEVVFDIGITPNRADCLSVLGLAREVAAFFALPLTKPEIILQEESRSANEFLEIEITDPALCPLYQARILQELNIGPSPAWMRYRLLAVGQRPINNIVDITNYVLFEYGQPLHAFDRFLVSGQKIRVAPAGRNLEFTTLDGHKRSLISTDLLIWDQEKPIALAGVMGGANSEIHPETTEAILESAIFNPPTIRKTGRRLGISSEAGYRFERGVDQVAAQEALNRAAALLQTHAQAKILRGVVKKEPRPWISPQITFRPERAKKLLALDFEPAFASNCLKRLGCIISNEQNQTWEVIPPSFRQDLEREVDLIEEVGRVYGLEKLPAQLPGLAKQLQIGPLPQTALQASFFFLNKIKNWAMGLGFKEVINYSFVGRTLLQELGLELSALIPVHNPLSTDQDTMRPRLVPGLLKNLKTNISQHCPEVRIFEIGRIFLADPAAETQCREINKLGLLIYGSSTPGQWPWPKDQADFLDLKGCLEHLWAYLQLPSFTLRPVEKHPFLEPALQITGQEETELGELGSIKSELTQKFDARTAVWYLEIDLDKIFRFSQGLHLTFRHWSKFPAVKRDLTIIANPDLKYEQILQAIQQTKTPFLEDITLQDIYLPDNGVKHLTLRLTYRHPSKTLTDKEVDKRHQSLGKHLQQTLDIRFP